MQSHQSFYSRGKLLLSGEYFVMDGARALALPTRLGQHLTVTYKKSYNPCLQWKGLNSLGNTWFEAAFELWKFDLITGGRETPENLFLQKILRAVRKKNHHFLRDEETLVQVTTRLEFPLEWGLGSSSTLIHNIAQWATISPFDLQLQTCEGSGYDIACAESSGPIFYEKTPQGLHWGPLPFYPPFSKQLYFVYLGKKKATREAISDYHHWEGDKTGLAVRLSTMTEELSKAQTLKDFEFFLNGHEVLISQNLKLPRVKDLYFTDYWGTVKSLGAWGGDFILVTSTRNEKETRRYFAQKGFPVFFPYSKIINSSGEGMPKDHDFIQ